MALVDFVGWCWMAIIALAIANTMVLLWEQVTK